MTDWTAYPISFGRLQRCAVRVHPEAGWRNFWKRIKLLYFGVLYGRWNVRWQEYLDTSYMRLLAWAVPQLYFKVQAPYLNRRYSTERRLEILRTHYDFMRERMSDKLCRRMLADAPVSLARWKTTEGDFSLRLDFPKRFWQEGELELALYHEPTRRMVHFIHFTISGPSEMSIGCIQGGKPVLDPAQISPQKLASAFRRDLHGLRHKNFLVHALRRIAKEWSITSLRAVSLEDQLFHEKIHADYNSFWTEEGGVLAPDGMYDLPIEVPSKGSRTKAAYVRRDQCLEAIGNQIADTLVEPWREIEPLDVSFGKAPEKPARDDAE